MLPAHRNWALPRAPVITFCNIAAGTSDRFAVFHNRFACGNVCYGNFMSVRHIAVNSYNLADTFFVTHFNLCSVNNSVGKNSCNVVQVINLQSKFEFHFVLLIHKGILLILLYNPQVLQSTDSGLKTF